MIEKVNPAHPDKIADRIAGALVDVAYFHQDDPRVAVEVLIGHKLCTVIIESSYIYHESKVKEIVSRIAGPDVEVKLVCVPQDVQLAANQVGHLKCGDNGIFKGEPLTSEEMELTVIAQKIYNKYPTDGKYILDEASRKMIICQSCCDTNELKSWLELEYPEYDITVNPLGDWTGGTDVDSGATNRKLGSDMGHSVTGGGLCGKDCSKADVSVNIYAWLEAQRTGKTQNYFCAIGDTEVNGVPYDRIVSTAKEYIHRLGGFEDFAMWGLI